MNSRIRIIAGTARGRLLFSPKGDQTRPMLGRVKDSLFNIIREFLPGSKVLDLFAGTGALGFESISRGADFCLFTEYHKESFNVIKQNIECLKFESQSKAVFLDAFKIIDYLSSSGYKPDIIFIAPPYRLLEPEMHTRAKLLEIIDKMAEDKLISDEALIVLEHTVRQFPPLNKEKDAETPGDPAGENRFPLKQLFCSDRRDYGQTALSFLKIRPDNPE
jgi:16S rRNA (guanine(966)-N(2))-methyltransferase RsmD